MRIGVFIVGSLYWDSLPVRAAWRANRLKLSDVNQVTAPIRYGRLSISRGNTYTMVFSQLCSTPDKLGTGLVVGAAMRCRQPEDLLVEAQYLWAAERNATEPGPVSASWGRVGLLVNPAASLGDEYLESWQSFPGRQRKPAPVAPNERPVVDEETGLALIDWPIDKRTRQPLDYDALLLTATAPRSLLAYIRRPMRLRPRGATISAAMSPTSTTTGTTASQLFRTGRLAGYSTQLIECCGAYANLWSDNPGGC